MQARSVATSHRPSRVADTPMPPCCLTSPMASVPIRHSHADHPVKHVRVCGSLHEKQCRRIFRDPAKQGRAQSVTLRRAHPATAQERNFAAHSPRRFSQRQSVTPAHDADLQEPQLSGQGSGAADRSLFYAAKHSDASLPWAFDGGRSRVRTWVGEADGFTDRSLWPLGQPAKRRLVRQQREEKRTTGLVATRTFRHRCRCPRRAHTGIRSVRCDDCLRTRLT